jgi:alpha-N-arabinofuranosidase
VKLEQKADGWYLKLTEDKAWRDEAKRKLVTTESLGKASIPDLPFENADGSPLRFHTDYFGKKRAAANPFPGPFEKITDGQQRIKVWTANDNRFAH